MFEFITKKQFYIKMITNENALYNFNYYSNIVKASYRLTLLFYHPIYYSVILVVGLFCIVYFPFRNKLVQVVSLLLVLLNLILTQSRTGWVVVGLCGLLYLIKHHHIQFTKKKLAAIYELLTLLLVGIGIFLLVRPEIVSSLVSIVKVRFDQAANGSATDVRFANFIVVKNIISDLSNLQITIFGGGNMYAISYLQNNPTFGYWNSAIDNSFLTVLLNYGIIGLFLLVIFIFQVIHVFFTKLSPERELSVLIVISIFIASFFFDIIGDNIIYYLLTIFIMLLPNNKVYESDNLMED
ncbi:O-antigen ligase family protein [Loigolactobacillus coryniformis]|uniref:O-antigen ligase family protein n=1 Tax=Loigolactobacillus coryniformis TaxID=1610 RepID=UPI00201A9146|nr:O-antigen ligase family protein [Loigolactobacillus coryniformis]